jgi:hypothetical protein
VLGAVPIAIQNADLVVLARPIYADAILDLPRFRRHLG